MYTGRSVLHVSYSTMERQKLFETSRSEAHCQSGDALTIHSKPCLEASIHTDVCAVCSFQKPPARCCAVGTVNTLKVAACVTAAGRVLSATFPPTSALTSRAAATGPASWGHASATRATKGRTAKKVMVLKI